MDTPDGFIYLGEGYLTALPEPIEMQDMIVRIPNTGEHFGTDLQPKHYAVRKDSLLALKNGIGLPPGRWEYKGKGVGFSATPEQCFAFKGEIHRFAPRENDTPHLPTGFLEYGVGPLAHHTVPDPDISAFIDGDWRLDHVGFTGDLDIPYALKAGPVAWRNGLGLPAVPEGFDYWETAEAPFREYGRVMYSESDFGDIGFSGNCRWSGPWEGTIGHREAWIGVIIARKSRAGWVTLKCTGRGCNSSEEKAVTGRITWEFDICPDCGGRRRAGGNPTSGWGAPSYRRDETLKVDIIGRVLDRVSDCPQTPTHA